MADRQREPPVIEVREEVTVPSAPDAVWLVLSDPYQAVSCIPGASLTGRDEDGAYEGRIDVRFGPTSIAFKAKGTFETDDAECRGTVRSRARDGKGGTKVQADGSFQVVPAATGSSIVVVANVDVTGPLASLVESGTAIVVRKMVSDFTTRLAEKLAPGERVATEPPAKRAWWQRLLALLGLARKPLVRR